LSKLFETLSNPSRSGVYRTSHDIAPLLSPSPYDVIEITLTDGKVAMMEAVAKALGFPDWFGGNWDALEDCLTDLSWRPRAVRVLLFSGASETEDSAILVDVLLSVAEYWRERGRCFFALFSDPQKLLDVPVLEGTEPG
jgi:RNAse (barnase) inhibitor barstar